MGRQTGREEQERRVKGGGAKKGRQNTGAEARKIEGGLGKMEERKETKR